MCVHVCTCTYTHLDVYIDMYECECVYKRIPVVSFFFLNWKLLFNSACTGKPCHAYIVCTAAFLSVSLPPVSLVYWLPSWRFLWKMGLIRSRVDSRTTPGVMGADPPMQLKIHVYLLTPPKVY